MQRWQGRPGFGRELESWMAGFCSFQCREIHSCAPFESHLNPMGSHWSYVPLPQSRIWPTVFCLDVFTLGSVEFMISGHPFSRGWTLRPFRRDPSVQLSYTRFTTKGGCALQHECRGQAKAAALSPGHSHVACHVVICPGWWGPEPGKKPLTAPVL